MAASQGLKIVLKNKQQVVRANRVDAEIYVYKNGC